MDYEIEELAWRYAELRDQMASIELELSSIAEKIRRLSPVKSGHEEFHLSYNNKILYVGWDDEIGCFEVFRMNRDY